MKSCLLIENDPEDQDYFIDALHQTSEQAGCFAVSTGEEAIETLIDKDFFPDYIFTEIDLPAMTGFEFLKRIKKIPEFSKIPVIVLCTQYTSDHIDKLRLLGAEAIYSKTRRGILKDILHRYFT